AEADGGALPGLRRSERDRAHPRRAQGGDRGRGHRGARPPAQRHRRRTMTAPVIVPVSLGERSYDILIGEDLIANAGAEIASRLPGIRVAIVTDGNVAAAHLDRL